MDLPGFPSQFTTLACRLTTDLVAPGIAASAQATGTVRLAKTFDLVKMVSRSQNPVRLRLYASAAARSSDLTRDRFTLPVAQTQHQIIFDLVLTGTTGYSWVASPVARGCTADDTDTVYYTLDNLDSVSRDLNMQLTYLKMEA